VSLNNLEFARDWSGSVWEDLPVLEERADMAGRMNPVHPVRSLNLHPPPG
jgi:hypothetical protein